MSQPPDQPQGTPRLRAGDAERQQAIQTLMRAWSEGRIGQDEYQRRSLQALAATFTDEIDPLLADVDGPAPYTPPASAAVPSATVEVRDSWRSEPDDNLPVQFAPEGARGSGLSVGIMSGMDKTGQWVVAPNHVTIGFWGGTTIDLRDALFVSAETTITCIAVMGGVEVIVPPEMDVQVAGIGFMGGFGWEKLHEARPSGTPTPGNPRVTITGIGFMGGVGVTRRERGESAGLMNR